MNIFEFITNNYCMTIFIVLAVLIAINRVTNLFFSKLMLENNKIKIEAAKIDKGGR